MSGHLSASIDRPAGRGSTTSAAAQLPSYGRRHHLLLLLLLLLLMMMMMMMMMMMLMRTRSGQTRQRSAQEEQEQEIPVCLCVCVCVCVCVFVVLSKQSTRHLDMLIDYYSAVSVSLWMLPADCLLCVGRLNV